MVLISQHFGGSFLTGDDLGGRTYKLQLGGVHIEQFDDGEKLILAFQNARKSLVLNKTNASTLAAVLGDDSEGWYGAWVEAFTVPVNFNGKMFQGVRLRVIERPAVPQQRQPTMPPAQNALADFEAERQRVMELSGPENIPF
jgi:hypothetical protein